MTVLVPGRATLVSTQLLAVGLAALGIGAVAGYSAIPTTLDSGAVLVKGPRGETGPMGPTGPPGAVGAVGPQGPQGVAGPTGPQGPTGADGAPGQAGPIGEIGPAGNDGAPGQPGPSGAIGPAGPTGDTGPMGPTGPQGETGPQGLAGPQGIQGIQGIQGEIGPMGPTGIVVATSPLQYNADTRTISLDLDAFERLGSLDYLQFNTSSTAERQPGRLVWNDVDGTLDLRLKENLVTLQIGQESVQVVLNNTGGTLLNGRAVRVTGSSGGRMTVTHADNSTVIGSTGVIGVLTEDIEPNTVGYVTTYGLVRDTNTSSWAAGAPLYADGSGVLTDVRPVNGRVVQIGYVAQSDATNGIIYVNPMQNFEPPIGGPCQVPGQTGLGTYAWHNLTGQRWIVVCDY
ncbi:collagen-like protein [Candidatus Rhodoluna planktonica]|uniref:Uncharacterized protein n=1 Tax=Candidatus Rhodoluna planktonica TaxID=535712 RepID=A0A1D9DYK7_9MICO|nr:collagen-like protein [Candidatus Rhodoluna planktonica]AOY55896.1 hypothetical protein A4Z71_02600 [Candidatus Rhodoluna planktonica]